MNTGTLTGIFPPSVVTRRPPQVPARVPLPAGQAVGWLTHLRAPPRNPRLLPRTSTVEPGPTRQMTSAARLTCTACMFSTRYCCRCTVCWGEARAPVSEATPPLPSFPGVAQKLSKIEKRQRFLITAILGCPPLPVLLLRECLRTLMRVPDALPCAYRCGRGRGKSSIFTASEHKQAACLFGLFPPT